MKKEYFVKVHVKPYVFRWLMRNYFVNVNGLKNTVSLKRNFELKSMFLTLLENRPYFYNSRENTGYERRNCEVYIYAGPFCFDHGAYNLTYTAETLFAVHLESVVKADLIAYANYCYMFEPRLDRIIERYKEQNGYSEDDWPTESMKKILFRSNIRESRAKAREHFLHITDNFYAMQLSYFKANKRLSHANN